MQVGRGRLPTTRPLGPPVGIDVLISNMRMILGVTYNTVALHGSGLAIVLDDTGRSPGDHPRYYSRLYVMMRRCAKRW